MIFFIESGLIKRSQSNQDQGSFDCDSNKLDNNQEPQEPEFSSNFQTFQTEENGFKLPNQAEN